MKKPDHITISERLRRAESLDQFRSDSGNRIHMMPYYRRLSDGSLVFDFIGDHTNARQLEGWIKEGMIWIRDGEITEINV